MNNQYIISTFHCLCLITTAGVLIYCSWKYYHNEGTSLVDFKTYHNTENDIYPSISLCFQGGIWDTYKLNHTYAIDKVSDYSSFLKGNAWDDLMLKVNYDDVTLNLKDYVTNIQIGPDAAPEYSWTKKNNNNNPSRNTAKTSPKSENDFPFYIGYRHARAKCFSLDLSKEVMPGIDGKILTSVQVAFQNMRLPSTQLAYYLHYPKQLIRTWPLIIDADTVGDGIIIGNSKVKLILVNNVDVLRRRNTIETPCHNELKGDDDVILTKIIEEVGCKPSHWVINVNYLICNDKAKMKKAYIPKGIAGEASFLKRFVQPCDGVQTVTFNIKDLDVEGLNDNTSMLYFMFTSWNYKEIQHIRAFDIENLIGNMGGYVGLFLGFAFWQAPDVFKVILNRLEIITRSFE